MFKKIKQFYILFFIERPLRRGIELLKELNDEKARELRLLRYEVQLKEARVFLDSLNMEVKRYDSISQEIKELKKKEVNYV